MALKNGSRFAVSMDDVFPRVLPGARLDRRSAGLRREDEAAHASVERVTGKRVFQVRVSDLDEELEGRYRETVVKMLAD